HTTLETDLRQAITFSWRVLDLVSVFLPTKVLVPLVLGRMCLEIYGGVERYREDDLDGVLRHAYSTLSLANDAFSSMASTGLVRRVIRGLPKRPPLPLPG
ncbi:hypothetical protein NL393_31645, partial [Klebsiella pneumoniae]|nr:hypothetical protein [Klebsiella pneumoniae]